MDPRPLLLLPLIAAGCTADRTIYPSLAPRAVEKRTWDEPASPVPPPVATDPALAPRIADQIRKLATAASTFDSIAARVATLAKAAKGETVGGDRWIAAQTALADLDVQRAATLEAGSALGQLALDRAAAGQPDDPALDAASKLADAQLDAETRRIADLQALLPQG